ncbi:hypothetical protein [Paenibacillus albidus]|uniref:hypothetical protein n=1 Tax=Paenibacillus albidus TaxID=2041023 RepID=UPI00288B854E|nr:hypothetical protein [Paenibacillus albidus]
MNTLRFGNTSLLFKYNYQSLFMGGMCILLFSLLMTVFVSRKRQTGLNADLSKNHVATVKLIEKKVLFPSLLIMLVGMPPAPLCLLWPYSPGRAVALYGIGFGAIFPAIQTWCVNLVDEHEHEHENAIASFFNFFDLGITGGISIGLCSFCIFLYHGICYFYRVFVVYILLHFVYSQMQRRYTNRHKEIAIQPSGL